jgi:hypothetical protein
MLVELFALAINSRETSQEKDAFVSARSNSWQLIIRLKNNSGEAQTLVKALTAVSGSLPVTQAHDWKKKLDAMPQHFHFGNHTVCYRQHMDSGVLLLAECIIGPGTRNQTANADAQPDILNASFFVTENKLNGKLELRCLPTDNAEVRSTTVSFSTLFFETVVKEDTGPSKHAVESEGEKKLWWRKVLGV